MSRDKLRFTHDRISSQFGDGKTFEDLINQLRQDPNYAFTFQGEIMITISCLELTCIELLLSVHASKLDPSAAGGQDPEPLGIIGQGPRLEDI